MPLEVLDYAPGEEFDTGLFVARYLQVVAWLQIVWMVVEPLFFHRFELNLGPLVLFWAASALKRRNSAARGCMLVICGWALLTAVGVMTYAMVYGPGEMKISLFRPISNPTLLQVLAVMGFAVVLVGVPFFVLASKKARRQFAAANTGKPEREGRI